MLIIKLLVSILLVKACQSQCAGTKCGECIASGIGCSWCRQTNFSANRCQPLSSLKAAGCEERNVENPQSFYVETQDENVRDSNAQFPHAIQIQPQKVRIQTRPRKEHRIEMTFRAANNFPVDLYFLFDNSYTMESQIKNLAKLASDIGQSISNISTNYQMAYGVFQDKVTLPFTETHRVKLSNPCADKRDATQKCAAPFEFKHLLNMTANVRAFKDRVDQTEVTGNIDHPEGSLDAILQAIKCKTEIGWREIGRKMLIFASNDRFHLAGDGRLAGIVLPNDGDCHLDTKGLYTKELEQDYPSVSQLSHIVEKNEVHIIFAVSRDQHQLFQQLSRRIIPEPTVKLLADPNDSSNKNIKEIIEAKYREIVSKVEIVHTKVKGVDVQIKATSENCIRMGTNKCEGLKIGIPIQFDVEVKVTECPSKPEERVKTVIIYPDSLKNDKLELEIETICECDCSTNQVTWEQNSEICSAGNGTLKCGLCDCNENRFGQFCECDASDIDSSHSGCRKPGSNTTQTQECSGYGTCECGVCRCQDGYSGPYCECNDRTCGFFQGEICGGAQGRCVCGKCECEPGYTGNTCGCPTANDTCVYQETLCSNAGTCSCGECKCTEKFIGKYCETCYLCTDAICEVESYRKCAECAFNKDKDCPDDCPQTQLVTTLEKTDGSDVCSVKQADDCFLSFRITRNDTNFTMLVRDKTICAEPVNVVPIAAGVVGGVVAIGLLLLLLWKILTTVFDKIEYSKFQEDLKHCKWAQEDNPFYKGPTTTYKNPMLESN